MMRTAIVIILCIYGGINALIATEERAAMPFAVIPLLAAYKLIQTGK